MRGDDLDRFYRFCVAAEHGYQHVIYDFDFCFVLGCDLDEDVFCLERDLAVVAVDDGRQGEHGSVCVVDDGIDGRVSNNVEVPTEMFVFLDTSKWGAAVCGRVWCSLHRTPSIVFRSSSLFD